MLPRAFRFDAFLIAAIMTFVGMEVFVPPARPTIELGGCLKTNGIVSFSSACAYASSTASEAITETLPTVLPVTFTAYTCEGHARCVAADGTHPIAGETVACPKDIPLGTRLGLVWGSGADDNGTVTCTDRTADWVQTRNGPTVDLYFDTLSAARAFGKRQGTMTILD